MNIPGGGTHPHRGQHDLVVRRSTDGGRSWEHELRNIFDAIGNPQWQGIDAANGRDTGNAVWDPTPLWDATTGRVWVFFNGTALSGSISTVLTVLSWICVGIHNRRALPSPVCA